METTRTTTIAEKTIHFFFLAALNLAMTALVSYLTLDSAANLNSRVGAVLLSFLLPYFIVSKTSHLTGSQRLLRFGAGFFADAVMACIIVGIPQSFVSFLLPCLVLGMGVLFYGNKIAGA